jgi:hypothetical protein
MDDLSALKCWDMAHWVRAVAAATQPVETLRHLGPHLAPGQEDDLFRIGCEWIT